MGLHTRSRTSDVEMSAAGTALSPASSHCTQKPALPLWLPTRMNILTTDTPLVTHERPVKRSRAGRHRRQTPTMPTAPFEKKSKAHGVSWSCFLIKMSTPPSRIIAKHDISNKYCVRLDVRAAIPLRCLLPGWPAGLLLVGIGGSLTDDLIL